MTIRTLAHDLVDARIVEEADIPNDNRASVVLKGGTAAQIAQAGPVVEVEAHEPVPALVEYIRERGSEVNMVLLQQEEKKGA